MFRHNQLVKDVTLYDWNMEQWSLSMVINHDTI